MSLQSLADQHRAAILRHEAQAAHQIADQWRGAWARTLARISTLFAQMQQAQQAGQDISIAWLYEQQRLQQTLHQIEAEMHTFSQQASQTVRSQMSQANNTGQQDAQLLLKHALGQIQSAFNIPQPQAQIALQQSLDSGPIANRFAKLPVNAVRRAKGTLLYALGQGWGPRKIAAQLRNDLAIPLNDALRISRTESLNAYRDGTSSIYKANRDVVTGWEWYAEPDACPECAAKNGSIHSVDEAMDEHPNGRCTQLPRTLGYEEILAA